MASAGTWLQTYLMAGVAQRAVRDLRNDLFAKLQTLSLRFFDQRAHGELMSRLTNDVENISNVLTTSATQLLSSVLGLVGVVVMMFALNVPLALVSLVVMPLTYVLTRFVARRTRQGFREQQQTLGALNGIIEETITGQRVVKAYVREQAAIEEFCRGQPPPATRRDPRPHPGRLHGAADEHGEQPGPGHRGRRGRLAGRAGAGDGGRRLPPSSTMPGGCAAR